MQYTTFSYEDYTKLQSEIKAAAAIYKAVDYKIYDILLAAYDRYKQKRFYRKFFSFDSFLDLVLGHWNYVHYKNEFKVWTEVKINKNYQQYFQKQDILVFNLLSQLDTIWDTKQNILKRMNNFIMHLAYTDIDSIGVILNKEDVNNLLDFEQFYNTLISLDDILKIQRENTPC